MEIGMDGKGFHLSFVVVYISNIYILFTVYNTKRYIL